MNATTNLVRAAAQFCEALELAHEAPHIGILFKTLNLMHEESEETQEAVREHYQGNFCFDAILDGFGDTAFVALNGVYKTLRLMGYNHYDSIRLTSEVMDRICQANLAKLQPDGSVAYNEFGKVMKPEGWNAPEYDDIVAIVAQN